jgi:biopolymer transport protein ExbB
MSAAWELFVKGGFVMWPLLVCSLLVWAIILERAWRYRGLDQKMESFRLEAVNHLLRGDLPALRALCERRPGLPTARLAQAALERLESTDARLRARWGEALERQRQRVNQDLRAYLGILATVGAVTPFVGLFGTVVGILKSFGEIAVTGQGGFTVVAAGISEALIATAAGIVVAVIAVTAYNVFQTRWTGLVLQLRLHAEELAENLGDAAESGAAGGVRSGG